ncbi:hypothetical protein BDZ88DRAFT_146112 [Geranomyces variabilis]|nr:hypothetical protein BDZ88DRAFT_146112 [Geranomyces variabilis]
MRLVHGCRLWLCARLLSVPAACAPSVRPVLPHPTDLNRPWLRAAARKLLAAQPNAAILPRLKPLLVLGVLCRMI